MGTSDDLSSLTVLTGFLGAGKTTLLNRILRGDHGRRIAVLVNDFGDINIDAELVVGIDEDMISLANGCVCCQVRDDLVESTISLLDQPARPDHIILEASGVADPVSLALTFTQEEFRHRLHLDGVIAVVDSSTLLTDEDVREHKLRQIVCADLAILNKADLASRAQLQDARDWIAGRAHRIRLIEAVEADVPLEVLLGRHGDSSRELEELSSLEGHGDHYETASIDTEQALDTDALARGIKALPASVYRLKGILIAADDPSRPHIVQAVGRRVTIEAADAWRGAPRTRLVAIGRRDTQVDAVLDKLVQAGSQSTADLTT